MSSIGVLESSGFSKRQRMLLFLFICIPLRLSFSLVAHKLKNSRIINIILLIAGIISLVTNLKNIKGEPWWSRRVHAISSILLVGSTIGSLTRTNPVLKSLPSLVLLADILYGVGTYAIVRPFSDK